MKGNITFIMTYLFKIYSGILLHWNNSLTNFYVFILKDELINLKDVETILYSVDSLIIMALDSKYWFFFSSKNF